ncbi:MAG: PLDc_N domain-containing protein [Sedimentisphaerales bacterium]|nr:PLDc_N domain-containing protein [Sedimentisphaerales bacterium]
MLWYVLNGLYLVIWSALLIYCLNQRRFYPIIGHKWGTKIFWLFTFVFFNPLLSLVYIIFGIALRPAKNDDNPKPVRLGSVLAVLCTGIVLVLFEIPIGGYERRSFVILSDAKADKTDDLSGSNFRFEPYIGYLKSSNKAQTYCSVSDGTDARTSIGDILIISNDSNHLLDRAVREFQKSLFRLPYVNKVAYYSSDNCTVQGAALPDVYITINMPQFSEKELFHGRSINATIKCRAGSSMVKNQSYSFEDRSGPTIKFDIESEINHVSTMMGIESPQAKYKLEANNIASELTKAITKQFEDLLNKYGRLPQLPEMLYGTYRQPPEFTFIQDSNVRQMISGSGLLKDNDTIWQFIDERRTEDALNAYCDELKSLGWTLDDQDQEYIRMRNGNERICIYRQRRREADANMIVSGDTRKIKAEVPMIAHYQLCWTEERKQEAMDKLLSGDVEIKTLLAFEKSFHDPQQHDRLYSIIEQDPTPSLQGYLMQTRYLVDHNEPEKGRQMLMLAKAMQNAEKQDDIKAQEIENLAEKLGDESLAEAVIGEEIFRKTGYINIDEIDKQMVEERGLDEPLLFYKPLEDGDIQTVALRIINSREPLHVVSYRLLAVEKHRGISNSSEKDGMLGADGSWVVKTDLYSMSGEKKTVSLKVESLGDERFRFVVNKIKN